MCCGYEGGPRRVGIDPSLRSNFSANPALYLGGKCKNTCYTRLLKFLLTNVTDARGFYFEICIRKNCTVMNGHVITITILLLFLYLFIHL